MLTLKNLEKFTKQAQTDLENVVREYCQHLFLTFLYQQSGSERLLFKGGTALRIVFKSPRYSEDLDFTGVNITQREVETLFADTLVAVENTGIHVELEEGKPTTGGYLGRAYFFAYGSKIPIAIQVSLRNSKGPKGSTAFIENEYITAYTLVHLSTDEIINGKIAALLNRHKPRDFYDYFFLLSGPYPAARKSTILKQVLKLLQTEKINFRAELRRFLPASHILHLKDFHALLERKIKQFLS